MKRFDRNQKAGLIALTIFIVFLIGFFVLSNLVQNEIIPDFTPSQRVQSVLAFFMALPFFIAVFFAGRYFKSKGSKVGVVLTFVAIILFAFGILQVILSLLGAYGT